MPGHGKLDDGVCCGGWLAATVDDLDQALNQGEAGRVSGMWVFAATARKSSEGHALCPVWVGLDVD